MTTLVSDGEQIGIIFVGADGSLPANAQGLLASAGYSLNRAADGLHALNMALQCGSELLVCDLDQTGVDGYGLCDAVRGDSALSGTRVLLLTSSSHPLDPQRAVRSGVDSFLQQPFDVPELIDRLDDLSGRPRRRVASRMSGAVLADGHGPDSGDVAGQPGVHNLLRASLEHAARVESVLRQREIALSGSNAVLNTLYRIAQALNQATCESEVLEMALDRALELPGVQAGWIQILEADTSFRLGAARNLPPALCGPGAFAGICECKRRVLEGEHGQVGGVIECARLANGTGDARGLRYHASIPLWLGSQRVLGLMNLVGPDQGLFGDGELEVLYNVGNQVAVALERVRLHGGLEQLVRERTAKLEQEIDERKRAERNQARLVAIIEATPDMVATSRADTTPLYCNRAGRRMVGIGMDEKLARMAPYPQRLVPMIRDEAIPYAMAHGSWSGESAFVRPDGQEIPVSQVIIAHRGDDGEIEYLSTIARNITAQKRNIDALKQLANELRSANQALTSERAHLAERVDERTASLTAVNVELAQAKLGAEQASRVKSAFLASMSHEIRTPMNGVIGMIDVLVESELTDYQRDLVITARESGNALLGIINDILDFSKIEAEQLELEHAPVSIFDLTEGVCSALASVAAIKGVEMSLFIAPATPQAILTDDVRLRQILYNLLGNAIKFSSGDSTRQGKVALRLTVAETAESCIAVEISDNGIGMSTATLAALFSPFKQAEITTTRRFGGTGLGLTICKRLVDMMGGTIAVRSTPGEGSVFTVTLPIEIAPDPPARDLPDLAELVCVILQSSRFAAIDLRAYLEFAGARVHQAADVAELRRMVNALAHAAPLVMISQAGALSEELGADMGQRRNIRHVLIGFGRRIRARVEDARTVRIDGNVIRQSTLLRAVAVAAGRASPEVFHDRLPARLTSGIQPPTVSGARAQGRLILVAEDDKVNQIVIQRQLALLGYAVEIAGNGVQALQMWRDGSYGMLLSDLHMPVMDGLVLTRSIREDERGLRHTPIVILSANALRGESARASACGADDYLTKPASLAQLKATIERWLPRA
ncbi:MAG: response regulator, partial [Burkholderiaceae bacterium]